MIEKKTKRLFVVLFVAIFALLPLMTPHSAQAKVENSTPESILSDEEGLYYLNLVEDSELFQSKFTGTFNEEAFQAMLMTAHEGADVEVDQFVLVVGHTEDNNGIVAVVDMYEKEVKRITEFVSDSNQVTINDYDYDGSILFQDTLSKSDFISGNFDGTITSGDGEFSTLNDPPSDPTDNWWYSWACSFSGLIACTVMCVGFGPAGFWVCETACNYFWSNSLC